MHPRSFSPGVLRPPARPATEARGASSLPAVGARGHVMAHRSAAAISAPSVRLLAQPPSAWPWRRPEVPQLQGRPISQVGKAVGVSS